MARMTRQDREDSQINRMVELEIKRGTESQRYITKIIYIDGTTVKLSPAPPMEIQLGASLIIHENSEIMPEFGAEARSYNVIAGPDPEHPEQPYRYQEKNKEGDEYSVLVVQQDLDEELIIRRRQLFRGGIRVPVILTLADSGKKYGDSENPLFSINLSGSGVLLSMNLDDESDMPIGTKVVLDFQNPDLANKLPSIKGTVVRIYRERARQYCVGIEFDDFEDVDIASRKEKMREGRPQNKEDQQFIIRYVMREEIKRQAELRY